jgi:hypothetical protein
VGSRVAAGGALLLALVACSGGTGSRGRAGGPTITAATTVATTTAPSVPAPGPTTTTAAPAITDRPGSVTLSVRSLTLPPASEAGAGGSGLRVLVRPASPGLTVRRTGGGEPVTACPVTSVAGPATTAGCVDLAVGRPVDVAAWGVELRATGAEATVDEVTVNYVPADRSLTLVTPARAPGVCAARPCQATFSLSPSQAGTFSLDARAGAGRPRLTLTSNSAPGNSIRTLATVEGGGNLSITATLDGAGTPTLSYRDESSGAVPAFTAEILWP